MRLIDKNTKDLLCTNHINSNYGEYHRKKFIDDILLELQKMHPGRHKDWMNKLPGLDEWKSAAFQLFQALEKKNQKKARKETDNKLQDNDKLQETEVPMEEEP